MRSLTDDTAESRYAVLGVDMPIGLPMDRPRACDIEARAFLGARRSTVFPTPPRASLHATDHADAVRLGRSAIGVGVSLQAFHLLPKMREVDALVRRRSATELVEIHPECSFAFMNDGVALPPKRSILGARARRALLAEHFEHIEPTPRGAAPDDVLDAYAVLWSVERYVVGTAHVFGDGAPDEHGLVMRIVA